ncbi:MAG: SRPBCC family protein [Gammaproteobacteria bacterium]|nr:MAG: SRPBCC family protein [Gammaproteobacteria bacterium]
MSEAKVVKTVAAPADAVWAQLGDFTGIEAGGAIDSVSFDGEGVGMTRTIVMGGKPVVERLEVHDSTERTFTYAIINEDSPLPFSNYSATVRIVDNGDGTSTVDWVGTFEPRGVEEADAINMATGIYAGAIKRARIALGVDG